MALPPLTMQASSTSQLQTEPIFSLNASTSALKDSNRRIHLPYASSCCGLPVLANRALPHNAACETPLALKLFRKSRGASSRSTDHGCLRGGQFHPAFGAEELERPEGALVGHLARV